ncbi:ATP-binding protein [Rhodococcus phenolicus]|uniref:ATP-binding protein n=1 Tax=Rhodococcus phenolicus TaxID=263849 RepID=UPI00082ABDD5|nr:ATP-binding protein [Rhodococcus phenolicus]
MNGDANLRDVRDRCALVEERVRLVVTHRRSGDPTPDDPFRGLYLSDESAVALLDAPAPPPGPDRSARAALDRRAAAAEASGAELRLRRLARAAALSDVDVDALLICMLPDLNSRFERLYGYLNDDVTRRRATVGLVLELLDLSPAVATHRSRLGAGAPLIDNGLVLVEDGERPFLTRGLRVPDRVTQHLLGDDRRDPEIDGLLVDAPYFESPMSHRIARAIRAGQPNVYMREAVGSAAPAVAAAALDAAGYPALCVDAVRLFEHTDPAGAVRALGREALLRGAGVVVSPVEALSARGDVLRTLCETTAPTVVIGTVTWDPRWSDAVPLQVDAVRLSTDERARLWAVAAGDGVPDGSVDAVANQFVLGPSQIERAVRSARASASLTGGTLTGSDLYQGARSQNAAGLERLARRIEPSVAWADLVLPVRVTDQLRELTARARYRERVLTDWRMRPGGGRGCGVTALFAGESGTGKTMTAEVIAGDLGLDLYSVNLAAVVDKYVGETEKNLERIFTEASGVNAVLLFDEADAVFGKRSEVRDAHDRYANIESAYLLQRMESFDGLAILATNLRANLDDAFVRRLDAIVDFPTPDETARRALWLSCFDSPAPLGDDLDVEYLARCFTLSGGNIRSAAITAAYLAAASDTPIGMSHVLSAVRQEYRKLGRLVPESVAAE